MDYVIRDRMMGLLNFLLNMTFGFSYRKSLQKKIDSARRYYRDEPKIIVSVTYKEGVYRDFSFHSPKYIVGVVRYVTK